MENKSSSNNIILIIIGLILVAGVSLFVGMNIGKTNSTTIITENDSEKNTSVNKENNETNLKLDESTALNVLQNMYEKAMDFYTFDTLVNCTWKTDNDSCVDLSEFWSKNPEGGYIKITNYDDVMNNVFTENGLEQFETFMKNDLTTTPFIKEENGHMYVNAPTSGFYTGYATRNIKVTNITTNKIEGTIDVVNAFAESEGSTDAVETKKIIIKKENNKWLVEEFAIPMHY